VILLALSGVRLGPRAPEVARVDRISRARSGSTLVFRSVPPSPRSRCRITSMSPSSSRTNRAEVPGFIRPATLQMNSSPIPKAEAEAAEPAPPRTAPRAAPVSARLARKPAAVQPTMLAAVGKGLWSSEKEPSGCRTTTLGSLKIKRVRL
jgi:hypothetical protein